MLRSITAEDIEKGLNPAYGWPPGFTYVTQPHVVTLAHYPYLSVRWTLPRYEWMTENHDGSPWNVYFANDMAVFSFAVQEMAVLFALRWKGE